MRVSIQVICGTRLIHAASNVLTTTTVELYQIELALSIRAIILVPVLRVLLYLAA